MSDIRFNQWLHNSGTGGVSQVDGGHVGIGTTNPLIPVGSGNTAILNVGVVTANSFYGSGANLTGITGTTINNNAANRVITGEGGTTLNGEANLTFDGSLLTATNTGSYAAHIGGSVYYFKIGQTSTSSSPRFDAIGSNVAIPFALNGTEKVRIDLNGNLLVGATTYQNGGFGGTSHGINISGTQPQILLHETDTDKDGFFGLASSILRIQTADSIPVTIWTNDTERLRIGAGGGHKITCAEGYYAANLTECNDSRIALNINQTRGGQTKAIAIGAVGFSETNTGIQAYDTSNNSANSLLLNPFGGKVNIGCPDNGTANARLNVEDSTNNSTNTLKLINKPSGANGKARLEFYTETSAGQGCSPYIMSTSGTDAFGSNSANDGGFQFHTRHGGSGTDVNALEISNKGYVLQPQRPYFKANKSGRITSTGVVVWNTVVYNNGGHYDSSNGRFYAPINGLYWFSAKINAYDRCDFWLQKNGTRFERGQYNTDNANVGWWSNQLTSIVEMTAGQYVEVYVSFLDQQSDPGEWLTFMGYLLN